jgi:hypothetical protein
MFLYPWHPKGALTAPAVSATEEPAQFSEKTIFFVIEALSGHPSPLPKSWAQRRTSSGFSENPHLSC